MNILIISIVLGVSIIIHIIIAVNNKFKDEDKSHEEFLSNMSHDLRTPLNAICGYTDLLLMTNLDNLDNIPKLNIIKDSSQMLLELINNILDYSKINRGKMILLNEPVKLKAELQQIISFHRLNMKDKKLKFIYDIDSLSDELTIYSDSLRLRQIINNLISNAIKFTNEGYVELKIFIKKNQIKLEVEDSGIGMDDITLSKIFNSFTQGCVSTTKEFGGSGLGLTITKNLIVLMKGKIEVESTYTEGSKFTITLPLKLAGI